MSHQFHEKHLENRYDNLYDIWADSFLITHKKLKYKLTPEEFELERSKYAFKMADLSMGLDNAGHVKYGARSC
tara:strand:+ start:360 stop:578 length:219 start_codon:yes stop_codon:yes gene_type:complete